jgi:hypothetical protein
VRTSARTNVRDTSLIAYDTIQASGKQLTQQNRVEAFIRAHQRCSRNEIAQGTGIRLASVCGRVSELMKDDPPRIRENGKKKCAVTGEQVYALEVVPAQTALPFGSDGG